MTRQFLTDPAAQAQPADSAPGVRPADPAPAQASPVPTRQDALAGAFPEWDLLPETPFIRRVK